MFQLQEVHEQEPVGTPEMLANRLMARTGDLEKAGRPDNQIRRRHPADLQAQIGPGRSRIASGPIRMTWVRFMTTCKLLVRQISRLAKLEMLLAAVPAGISR
ncbi:unnamed protein product, partial [Mesorhabditis spiculigera]